MKKLTKKSAVLMLATLAVLLLAAPSARAGVTFDGPTAADKEAAANAYREDSTVVGTNQIGSNDFNGTGTATTWSGHGTKESAFSRYDESAWISHEASAAVNIAGLSGELIGLGFSATMRDGVLKHGRAPYQYTTPYQYLRESRSISLFGFDLDSSTTDVYLTFFEYELEIPVCTGISVAVGGSVGAGLTATVQPLATLSGMRFNQVMPAKVSLRGKESVYANVTLTCSVILGYVGRISLIGAARICDYGYEMDVTVVNHDRRGTIDQVFTPLSITVWLELSVRTYDFKDMEWQWNRIYSRKMLEWSTSTSRVSLLNDSAI